jgi:hypothetical protein
MVLSIAARASGDKDDTGDDLNFCVNLIAARQRRSTKASESALREYVRTRPLNYGCFLVRYRQRHKDLDGIDANEMRARVETLYQENPTPDCHPIIGALRWYFRTETGAPWGPVAIWEQVLTHFMLGT